MFSNILTETTHVFSVIPKTFRSMNETTQIRLVLHYACENIFQVPSILNAKQSFLCYRIQCMLYFLAAFTSPGIYSEKFNRVLGMLRKHWCFVLQDNISSSLAEVGTMPSLAAAAALVTSKKKHQPYNFEINPGVRKRQHTRLIR